MAVNLRASVRSVIKELKKNITQKASELASLKDELKRHARVHELLGGQRTRTRRMRRGPRVDWNSVLGGLPATFTLNRASARTSVTAKCKHLHYSNMVENTSWR